MSRMGIQRIVNKSVAWSRHGKHAQIDPHILNPEKLPLPPMKWYGSLAELFRAERRRK